MREKDLFVSRFSPRQRVLTKLAIKAKNTVTNVALWLYDRNASAPSSFIASPYLSQVTLDLTLFATRQARTTFTKSPDRLNLKPSALWTASSTIAADVPGCHIR